MKWIDVNERLPEIGERVLVYCRSQGVQICYKGFCDNSELWLMAYDSSVAYLNISHWMELPEPPQ